MNDDRDFSISGRGITFALKFKDLTRQALTTAGRGMQELATSAGKFLQQTRDHLARSLQAIVQLGQQSDRYPGVVLPTQSSVKSAALIRTNYQEASRAYEQDLTGLRLKTQKLQSYTEAMADATRKTEEQDKAQQNAEKSGEGWFGQLAKIAAEAYGLKRAFDYSRAAALDSLEMNREIARINIGRASTDEQLRAIDAHNAKTRGALLMLMGQTRATEQETLQTFRLLAGYGIELDKSGQAMARAALQFGRMAGTGAEAILPLQREFVQTLGISDPKQVDAFVRVLNVAIEKIHALYGSESSVIENMQQILPIATEIGQLLKGTVEEQTALAKSIAFNGSAMEAAFERVGVTAGRVPKMLELMTHRTDKATQLFLQVIGQYSGIGRKAIEDAFYEHGDVAPLMRALTLTAKAIRDAHGGLAFLMPQLEEMTGGMSIHDLGTMAEHADELDHSITHLQRDLAATRPDDWSKRWKLFSATQGEVIAQLQTLYHQFRLTFGQGVLDDVALLTGALTKFSNRLSLVDKDGNLGKMGKFLEGAGMFAGPVMAAFGGFLLADVVARIYRSSIVLKGAVELFQAAWAGLTIENLSALGAALLNPWVLTAAAIGVALIVLYKYRQELRDMQSSIDAWMEKHPWVHAAADLFSGQAAINALGLKPPTRKTAPTDAVPPPSGTPYPTPSATPGAAPDVPTPDTTPNSAADVSQDIADILAQQASGTNIADLVASVARSAAESDTRLAAQPTPPPAPDNRAVVGAVNENTSQTTKLLSDIRDILARNTDPKSEALRKAAA